MNSSLRIDTASDLARPGFDYRVRYYGFCAVVALAFVLMGRWMYNNDGWAPVYLPVAGATMLMISLAGVEFHLFLRRLAAERETQTARREEAEHQAIERQRAFNTLWQTLADNRGHGPLPPAVLTELAALFSADMVAVWASDGLGGFRLAGMHPQANDGAVRLEKVAQMSPCFEKVREALRLTRVSNFEQETTKAFAWFCEENGFQHSVLCPVLVRRDMVGVLAFFYRENPQLSPKLAEEMQSAANLFLCAL